ncbi:AraC family transcriptional regulator [Lewinellaceae bacterium SD302]|nr:AraC family transcriptional regulator [Lewinellaceae bacterium SD302]
MTTLYVKNMVCERCVKVVREELTATNYTVTHIELGRVVLAENFTDSDFKVARLVLQRNGFELLDNEEQKLVEMVKKLVIQHVHGYQEKAGSQNFSEYLSDETGVNYFKLSKLFSTTEGVTIEKYIIHQKIEKVKELLLYGEQTLGEIAFELDYSSTAHLSGQFKSVVGLTPTEFKRNGPGHRKPLDEV